VIRKRAASIALVTCVFTLGICASALAAKRAGERTFEETYPVASRLCARVAAGTEGRRLKLFATRVSADCAALESNFTAAQTAVLATRAAISAQIASERDAINAACTATVKAVRPLCRSTRHSDESALRSLRRQMHAAAKRYYRTAEAGRQRFWNDISSLRGGHHVRTDAPVPQLTS
jgi:hypothetical protein